MNNMIQVGSYVHRARVLIIYTRPDEIAHLREDRSGELIEILFARFCQEMVQIETRCAREEKSERYFIRTSTYDKGLNKNYHTPGSY